MEPEKSFKLKEETKRRCCNKHWSDAYKTEMRQLVLRVVLRVIADDTYYDISEKAVEKWSAFVLKHQQCQVLIFICNTTFRTKQNLARGCSF